MLRFSLYAMTQPMQFTIFTAEILANRFESSALVAGNLYERLAGAGVDTLPLITESGDQGQRALSLSKGTDADQLLLLPALTLWRRPRRRQGQALRVALRRLRASLDPSSGRRV